jgi:hypothetical protein
MGSLADASGRRYVAVPTDLSDQEAWLKLIARALNSILQGKTNNTGTVTLTANAGSTTLTDARIGANSVISLMPTTANAAGALATTYFGTFLKGSCVMTHTNNAQVDKTFSYTVVG